MESYFLQNEVWYITTTCPQCGLVDEAVAWANAKTPKSAAQVAEARHETCRLIHKAWDGWLKGVDEVKAAEAEVERVEQLLLKAVAAVDELESMLIEAREADPLYVKKLAHAKAEVERYRDGPEHARAHLAYVKATNTPKE